MFTSPKLNAVYTVAWFLCGRRPEHLDMVRVHRTLLRR